ncbi:MAG: hypothetical protein M5U26_30775 [Planctomycetota bacterium]|nr:hypothetical protein [Planctomycetota bacterium]
MNWKTRGRDAHASRRGRRRYGGSADPWHGCGRDTRGSTHVHYIASDH